MELREVTLVDMLDAREARAARQRELLEQFQTTLVSFTMNIAGPVKNSELILAGYLEGLERLQAQLDSEGFPVLHFEESRIFTGNEALFAVDAPARAVKRLTCQIEEDGRLGRLFDMDVLDIDGRKLDREEVGGGPRNCIVCGAPGKGCASRRVHTVEELQEATRRIMKDHFAAADREKAAALVTRALLDEVCTTPKPGLVDRANNGSHPDMDFYTFLRSAAALTPWFRDIALQGIRSAGESPEAAFRALNYVGRQAERAMLQATGGVNAHKGAIFSMGLLCGGLGRLYGLGASLDADRLLDECATLARHSRWRASPQTAGERFHQSHGVGGVRGEAASGFPLVRELGLPLLRKLLKDGHSPDDAGGIVLLHLMARAEDTCLISRAGHEPWNRIREQLRQVLSGESKPDMEFRTALDEEFIRHNWSAGGCADLLAVCWMILFLEEETAVNATDIGSTGCYQYHTKLENGRMESL